MNIYCIMSDGLFYSICPIHRILFYYKENSSLYLVNRSYNSLMCSRQQFEEYYFIPKIISHFKKEKYI
jgi:hypothetical protein